MANDIVQIAIDYLNEMLALDREATGALLTAESLCNKEFADHPTCICWDNKDGSYKVRTLGFLNGMLLRMLGKELEGGPICVYLDDATGRIIKVDRWVKKGGEGQ